MDGRARGRGVVRLVGEVAYVLVIASIATLGFVSESTALILGAAALSLPASVVAVPLYYMAFGILGSVPGANPSHSTGSVSCSADGLCSQTGSSTLEVWFAFTTGAVGVLALTLAAVANVLLVRLLTAALRRRRQASAIQS